jgi:hypothetical protein
MTSPTPSVRELLATLAVIEDEIRHTPTDVQDADGRSVPNPELTKLALRELSIIDALRDQSALTPATSRGSQASDVSHAPYSKPQR